MADDFKRARELTLNLRVSEEERLMLLELAAWQGLSQSDVVRQLVRTEHRRESAQQKPKPRGKGRS